MESSTLEAWAPPAIERNHALRDEQIEHLLRAAFSPHRCIVRFVEPPGLAVDRKVALNIFVWTGARADEREFAVGGVSLATLRAPNALADYVNEVRRHLRQRRVVFQALSFAHSLADVRGNASLRL